MGPVPPPRSQSVRALPGSQGRAAGLTPLRQLQAKSWATATPARLWRNCSPHFTAGPGAWEQPGGPSKGATQSPDSREAGKHVRLKTCTCAPTTAPFAAAEGRRTTQIAATFRAESKGRYIHARKYSVIKRQGLPAPATTRANFPNMT